MKKFLNLMLLAVVCAAFAIPMVGCSKTSAGDAKGNMDAAKKAAEDKDKAVEDGTVGQPPN